jgi:hypothetical protein
MVDTPNGDYHCDTKSDKAADKHRTADGMHLCDVTHREELGEAAEEDDTTAEHWVHKRVRLAEDTAWQQGYEYAVMMGNNANPVLARLLERLAQVDDDEIGLMLAELRVA